MAEEEGYNVIVTTDQSIRYQQNLARRRLAIVVLLSTAWPRMAPGAGADEAGAGASQFAYCPSY